MAAFAANRHHHDFDCDGEVFPDPSQTAVDCGDLDDDHVDPHCNRETIREAIATILQRGAVPIVLGGDDSIPIPMLQAYSGKGSFTVLQVDAHIDWRDSYQGEHYGLSSTMRRASEMHHIDSIVQVGQRGIGSARPQDLNDATNWGVKFLSARDVQRCGVQPALQDIADGADVIISFDCDSLDPSIMPGVIGRAPGGLSYWQLIELLEGVAAKARIAGMALAEFMPERDIDGIGALTAGRIVTTVLGLVARQVRSQAAVT